MSVFETQERVEAAVAAFARGELVVVTDDDDRENEGDLFVAASLCTPEKMAFIIRHTSGIVCAPLSAAEARRLHLDPMVAANDAPLANGNSGANDFVRPGHVFPLVAKEGGVLMRSGHTEACIDLCKLAGLPPVGVLSELMNDDGTVMRGPAVAAFAQNHKLTQISIADIIAYRQVREKLVKRVAEFPVKSEIGTLAGFAYLTPFDSVNHMAVVYGKIGDGKNVLARLHRADLIRDVFGGANPVHAALQRIKQEGRGVVVILRDGTAGVPSHSIPSQDTGSEAARTRQWREVGLGAQILKDLGISSIRLLASARFTYVGLGGFGIEITDTETTDV
jgi:3,4-dihydroxy 2-butanone 4-phosphate synthase/GTP cyclohydrolase II